MLKLTARADLSMPDYANSPSLSHALRGYGDKLCSVENARGSKRSQGTGGCQLPGSPERTTCDDLR